MTTSPVEYDVYIAFNLKDDEAVREIAGRLKKAGVRAWLLEWHVSGSVGWSVKLEEALKRSASSALFVGSAGFDPPPNEEVLESIREREEKSGGSFRVIPVLLPGADVTRIPSFLFGKSWVNFRDGLDDENAFAMLLAGIRGVAPGARMGGRREPGGEAERTPASEDDEGAGDAVALSETSWPETFDEEEENSISVGGASETSGPLGHFMELSPVVQEQFGDEEQTALEIAGTMGFKAKHDVDSVLFLAALLGTAPRDLKHSGFYFLNVLRKHRGGDAEIDAVELLGLTEYDIISIPSDTEGSWGDVPATAELTDLCERAAEVATITKSNQGTVLTRHIIGAVLAPSASDNSSAALQQLEKQGYDTQALRSDFLSHIQKHHRTTYDDWQKILFPGAGRPADAAHAAAESQTREPAATTTPQPTPPPPAPETEAGRESIQQASISDQPSVKDTLGFAPYVKAIATFLNNEKTQPPLTLSVEGEWGSGKSSFMLQLAGELSEATRRRRWLAMRREARGLPFHRQLTGSPLPNFRRLERLMLRRRMRAEARRVKCLTVEFNPWRHDKEDALWASFALEFVRKLSEGMRRRERVVAYFRLLLRRFSWKGGWLVLLRLLFLVSVTAAMTVALVQLLRADGLPPWAEAVTGEDKNAGLLRVVQASGVAGYLAVALFFLSKFRELVGNPFAFDLRKYVETPDYEGRIAFIEQFHEDFNKIVETYAGRNKVYVFIDDLDRCDVPKAADLMQAINLMISGGAPQLIFVIGMDREKVAAGLAVKNEKLLPYLAQKAARTAAPAETRPAQSVAFGLEYGYNFIEKFIQIPFRVPQPAQMGVRQLLDFISPLVEDAADGGDKSQPPAVTPAAVAAPTPRDAASPAAHAAEPARAASEELKTERDAKSERDAAELLSAAGGTEVSAVAQNAPEEKQEEEKEGLMLLEKGDSPTVRNIVLMAAPALDYNPRRIKQFINLFRLKAYIAYETGLFRRPRAGSPYSALTLEQLGKFVAIGLRWPRLLADLDDDYELLQRLQRATDGSPTDEGDEAVANWRQRPELMSLLRLGLVGRRDPFNRKNPIDPDRYSLAGLDVSRLLQVSPRAMRGAVAATESAPQVAHAPVLPDPDEMWPSAVRADEYEVGEDADG